MTQECRPSSDNLWCVNIQGPDDIHACRSKEAAHALATYINLTFGPNAKRHDVLFEAVVIPWERSADDHETDCVKTALFWGKSS